MGEALRREGETALAKRYLGLPPGSAKLFHGAYPCYAIVVYDGSMVKVDALGLSNGLFYSGRFSDSNVADRANANGAPGGRAADRKGAERATCLPARDR